MSGVESELLPRHWVTMDLGAHGSQAKPFILLSWNILADCLAHVQFEDRTSTLGWSARSKGILGEIKRADADIVCLCEVDHFEDFFIPALQSLGYRALTYIRNRKSHGCALFCRARFTLMRDYSEEYSGKRFDPTKSNAAIVELKDETPMATPEEKGTTRVIIAMTHLKAGGSDTSLRRRDQMKALLAWLGARFAFMKCVRRKLPEMIICGDLNDPPGGPIEELACSCRFGLPALKSAYSLPFRAPRFTAQDLGATWCQEDIKGVPLGGYMGTLDYIYHSSGLQAISVLQVPKFSDTVRDGPSTGIPSAQYPSDHVALAASFHWNTASPQNIRGSDQVRDLETLVPMTKKQRVETISFPPL